MTDNSSEKTELAPLIIVSGPSGCGKSTLLKRLLESSELPLEMSISATTRDPRPHESDGVHYHFLTHDEFESHRKNGDFLEFVEVFGRGQWYGTFKKNVTTSRENGKWIILEIDVEGAMRVAQSIPDAITIFIHPGSIEELERRLRGRGTETEEKILRRLEVAKRELERAAEYQHVVVNDQLDEAIESVSQILKNSGDRS